VISKRLHPASFSNVNAQLAQKANMAQEAWITPTLLNSWTQHTASFSFFKDNFGIVHFKGRLVPGTTSQPCFTLPVGYRPGATRMFPTIDSNGSVKYTGVQNNGDVVIWAAPTTYCTMDVISFKAEA